MRRIISLLHFLRDLVVWLGDDFINRNFVGRISETAEGINLGHIAIEYFASMKLEWISRLEHFLERNDFGKNWDGAYQDAVPILRQFFHREGFRTQITSEWESPSRNAELVATKQSLTVRIPWAEDYNGKSLVDLNALEVQSQRHQAAE